MESYQQYYLQSPDASAPFLPPTKVEECTEVLDRYYEEYLFDDANQPEHEWPQVEWAVSRWERTRDTRYLQHAMRLIGDALFFTQSYFQAEDYEGDFQWQ